jgi:hypothetical protein
VYGVVPFAQALSQAPPDLATLSAFKGVDAAFNNAKTEFFEHTSRRYAGPASYRIDSFVHGPEPSEVAPPPASAAATETTCLIVHGVLSPAAEQLLSRLRSVRDVTAIDLGAASRPKSPALHQTRYNGASVPYREDDGFYRFVGSVAGRFDNFYVLDDLTYLFHAGQWKSHAKKIGLILSRWLTDDGPVMLQGVEHSIHAIYCDEQTMPKLSAAGMPRRKLRPLEELLENWETEAVTPMVSEAKQP